MSLSNETKESIIKNIEAMANTLNVDPADKVEEYNKLASSFASDAEMVEVARFVASQWAARINETTKDETTPTYFGKRLKDLNDGHLSQLVERAESRELYFWCDAIEYDEAYTASTLVSITKEAFIAHDCLYYKVQGRTWIEPTRYMHVALNALRDYPETNETTEEETEETEATYCSERIEDLESHHIPALIKRAKSRGAGLPVDSDEYFEAYEYSDVVRREYCSLSGLDNIAFIAHDCLYYQALVVASIARYICVELDELKDY